MEETKAISKEEFKERLITAKSPEELVKLAGEFGVEFSLENAQKLYDKLHAEGELSDDELEGVVGGCVISDWFDKAFSSVKKFFTEDVKDFFTEDVPKFFEEDVKETLVDTGKGLAKAAKDLLPF